MSIGEGRVPIQLRYNPSDLALPGLAHIMIPLFPPANIAASAKCGLVVPSIKCASKFLEDGEVAFVSLMGASRFSVP
jgi:hypothetical protein